MPPILYSPPAAKSDTIFSQFRIRQLYHTAAALRRTLELLQIAVVAGAYFCLSAPFGLYPARTPALGGSLRCPLTASPFLANARVLSHILIGNMRFWISADIRRHPKAISSMSARLELPLRAPATHPQAQIIRKTHLSRGLFPQIPSAHSTPLRPWEVPSCFYRQRHRLASARRRHWRIRIGCLWRFVKTVDGPTSSKIRSFAS